jgi:hypothetical protein
MLSSIADTWISDFSKWHEPKLPTDALVFQLGSEAFSGFLNLRRVQQTLGIPGWSASTSAKVWCLNSASRRNLKDRFHIPRIVRALNERTANLQWMNEFCTPEEFPKLALQSNPPKKDRKVTYHYILVGFYCFYFSILTARRNWASLADPRLAAQPLPTAQRPWQLLPKLGCAGAKPGQAVARQVEWREILMGINNQ